MLDPVETRLDIRIQHPADLSGLDRHVHRVERIVWTAARSEAITEPEKVDLIDRLQHPDQRLLDHFVLDAGDPQRPLPTVGLGYPPPQHWAGPVASRLDRLAFGLAGDVEPVGQGVSELRIHHGPGYRIYFQKRGSTIIVLLCGGDKSTQAKDIKAAKRLAEAWSE